MERSDERSYRNSDTSSMMLSLAWHDAIVEEHNFHIKWIRMER